MRSPSKKRWRTASCKDATRETGNIIFARLCYTSAEAPFKTARHRVSVQRNNAAKGQLRRRPLRCRPAVSPGSASSTTIFFFHFGTTQTCVNARRLAFLIPIVTRQGSVLPSPRCCFLLSSFTLLTSSTSFLPMSPFFDHETTVVLQRGKAH